jgi:hypothetical protein
MYRCWRAAFTAPSYGVLKKTDFFESILQKQALGVENKVDSGNFYKMVIVS